MTNKELLENAQLLLKEEIISFEEMHGVLVLEISSTNMYSCIEKLKSDSTSSFNFLTLIGAVHYPENKGKELSIVYHLHSWKNKIRLRLKADLSIENPIIQSLVPLFPCANWMERETFDFFGVNFEGHPDLRRILNMDSLDYHPLLKQYHLEDETREDKDDRFFGR